MATGPRLRPLADGMCQPVPFDALSYLEWNAGRRPDATAVWQDGVETSFAALRAQVWALMEELRRRDLSPGSVAAVALPNVAGYVALELAVPAIGATLFPLPMGIGHRELATVLLRSGARLLITDGSAGGRGIADLARGLPVDIDVVGCEELAAARGAAPTARPGCAVLPDPDRIVQIALTSGTTGLPKLAALRARLKQLTFEGFTTRLGITPSDRILPMSPITQGVGEMCLYVLRRGAAVVMMGEGRFDPDTALSLAERSGATIIGGVPTMIGRILHSPVLDATALPNLRATVSAGAPLPPLTARRWEERSGSRTASFYGAMDIGQLAVPDLDDPAEKRWTTVGRPHDRAEVLICDPHGDPVAAGQTGEICMRGPLVQDLYWGEDVGPYAVDGWAHFGDLGFLDAEGFLHITGRLKDTIIRGGNNINPLEVEELLREHDGVRDACLVGRPDPDLGERAVAFVVPANGNGFTFEDMTEFLHARELTRYKWPEHVVLIDTLPLGATGKIDRTDLRRRAAATETEPS